jgi:hypothetical protein
MSDVSVKKYDPTLSHFDLDQKRGAQTEMWIDSIRDALAQRNASIECKYDSYYMSKTSEDYHRRGVNPPRIYIETECRGRDDVWRPSGINVTKASLWVIQFGKHCGGLIIETAWLKRAVEHAVVDPKNKGYCSYGENPTRGVFIYMSTIHDTRDRNFDER